jgi:hypothetical protein
VVLLGIAMIVLPGPAFIVILWIRTSVTMSPLAIRDRALLTQ